MRRGGLFLCSGSDELLGEWNEGRKGRRGNIPHMNPRVKHRILMWVLHRSKNVWTK